jgi:hypothetical protein
VIKAEYGPTLPQLLAVRSLAVRVGAAVLAGAVVLAAIVGVVLSRPDETALLVRKPVTFNFAYGPQFTRLHAPGTLVSLRNERNGLFLDAYRVRDLKLPPYRGAVGGLLPVYATHYLRTLGARYPGFQFVGEGRARINNAIGYEVTFNSRIGSRRLYVRHYLLVPDGPDGVREGVILELESTPAAGTPNAAEIGSHGALKMALRSFRFGTDRSGGTA